MSRPGRLRSSPRYGSLGGGASSRIEEAAHQSIRGHGSKCAARSGALSSTSRRNSLSSDSVQAASIMEIPSTISGGICGKGRSRGEA